ncbi:vWA domain-containing protein [Actinospongicola halichondriae]|uniref:vWA domain-containing protein n=1 Tax=Actinospongicola halichondriae TaxID=3236844 RepID=UPI003D39CCD7
MEHNDNLIPRPHFFVLLDRSGSMETMRADVIGGFNNLLAEQRDADKGGGPDARLTLVQFDSQDPHDVLVDGARITKVRPLSNRTFVPRGGTPLLDATGRVITMASVREQQRATLGKRPEVTTIITITDGHENQSREFRRRDILRLVKEKEAHGWTFAYLGAGMDAYGEAGGIGYDHRSTMSFAPDGTGAVEAFANVSRAMTARREKLRKRESYDVADFYEGDKGAEADRDRRGR